MKMKKPTCPTCGSDEVTLTGQLRWSPRSRRYLPHAVQQGQWECRPCREAAFQERKAEYHNVPDELPSWTDFVPRRRPERGFDRIKAPVWVVMEG